MRTRILIPIIGFLLSLVPQSDGADIYVIARQSYNDLPFNRYQFGKFDIDNPNTAGGTGNYVYAFGPAGSLSLTARQSLAVNPTNSTMYLIDNFNSFRSIDTAGTISASLGTTANAGYGMSFSGTGELYGVDLSNMIRMNSATGATISSSPISTGFVYSTFGGNMSWASGEFYFADQNTNSLVTISTTGTVTNKGAFSGTGYDSTKAQVLFMHLNQMYMLNGLNLFTVNLANGAMSKLGSISGVGGVNPSPGFAGAASFTPVPEPSTIVMSIAAGTLTILLAGRRRRSRD